MQDDKRGESSRKQPVRLPIIAPKHEYGSSASPDISDQAPIGRSAIPPRSRLPPRSRTGCWTCRHRKVKCDEGRPVCGQCARLGHNCDYSPRLAFRDDTPRVLERMQEITLPEGSVWDPTSPSTPGAGTRFNILDDLPPFAHLLTDEDRERKAEGASPGTYHVVVNPDSFQDAPEDDDEAELKREELSWLHRASVAPSISDSGGREVAIEGVPIPGDPNVVILPRVNDRSRVTPSSSKPSRSPVPSLSQHHEVENEDTATTAEAEVNTRPDPRYFQHFRDHVWKHIVPNELDQNEGEAMQYSSLAILTDRAREFSPLVHAMTALSALSLAQYDENERVPALQSYQQVISTLPKQLRNHEDLYSDSAFLTHFLMLVYEIAAAEATHSHVWSQHLSTLLRISLQRQQAFGDEAFPFLIWWIFNIDLEALLSSVGDGEYIAHVLQHNMIPPPSQHLYPPGVGGRSIILPSERFAMPILLQLDHDVTVLAAQLGLLAKEFRSEQELMGETDNSLRHIRISKLQDALRQLWAAPAVHMLRAQQFPMRAKQVFWHAWTLYRACIIYSHTSMWPTQRLESSPNHDTEIEMMAGEVLQFSQTVISQGRLTSRYFVFPIFMAGLATSDGHLKALALELVQNMADSRSGRNTSMVVNALIVIYEAQQERFMHTGHSLDVDWQDVMKRHGLSVVNFGL